MKYRVIMTETTDYIYEVEADDEEQAIELVETNGDIVQVEEWGKEITAAVLVS